VDLAIHGWVLGAVRETLRGRLWGPRAERHPGTYVGDGKH